MKLFCCTNLKPSFDGECGMKAPSERLMKDFDPLQAVDYAGIQLLFISSIAFSRYLSFPLIMSSTLFSIQ